MVTENVYERYGLKENPFHTNAEDPLQNISVSHVNFFIDDKLSSIKETVFLQQQKAVVLILGDKGLGKTERLLISKKEAEMNDMLHAYLSFEEPPEHAMKALLDALLPKGSAFLSNDKWERIIAKLKKTVSNSYNPSEIATELSSALTMHKPVFILLDDIEHCIQATDGQQFLRTMIHLMNQSQPGIFFLMTMNEKQASNINAFIPQLKKQLTHTFKLKPITDEKAEEIIANKFESLRMVTGIKSIFPFGKDAIAYLNKKANGNISKLFQYANIALISGAYRKAIVITEPITVESFNLLESEPWYNNGNINTDLFYQQSKKTQPRLRKRKKVKKREKEGSTSKFMPSFLQKKPKITSENDDNNGSNYKMKMIRSSHDNGSKTSQQHVDYDLDTEIISDQHPDSSIKPIAPMPETIKESSKHKKNLASKKNEQVKTDSSKNKKTLQKKPANIKSKDTVTAQDETSISTQKPTVSSKEFSKKKRVVRVKCPKCNQLFQTKINKNRTLQCPHCNFSGKI